MLAQVAPESAGDLAEIASHAALPGYTSCGVAAAPCQYHRRICQSQVFIDAANAAAYGSNLRGGTQSNLWIYNVVQIHSNLIAIESGYGGRGAAHSRVETAFLLDIVGRPAITLQHWSIRAGGDGYDYRVIQEGAGLDALRAYIG
jgi:hypothetical protein